MLVEKVKQHDVALAKVRAEAAQQHKAELAVQETELAAQAAEQVAAAEGAAQAEAAQMLDETTKQHDVTLAEVRGEAQADVARAEARLAEVEQTLSAIRQEADLTQAEVQRLRAERTDQREPARREVSGHHEGQPTDLRIQFGAMREAADMKATPAPNGAVTRRGMAGITGAVVLAGFTGTLIGWFVDFSRFL